MSNDELEFIDDRLASHETLLPSSGFAARVMEAVRREAATPPAIPFPWKLAVPGMVAFVACVALLVVGLMRAHWAMSAAAVPSISAAVGDEIARYEIGWVALSLLVTAITVKIAFRLGQTSNAG
jgi:hypothetical protein